MLGRMWHASRRALNLKHSPAHQFACSQWQAGHRPTNLYLLYRWLIFIAMVSIGISSFASQQLPKAKKEQKNEDTVKDINYFKWFIYFTNWGFMLIIVQSALALAVYTYSALLTTYSIVFLFQLAKKTISLRLIAVTAQPIRAAHALYGAAIGLVYGVFSACYWAVGGTDKAGNPAIYPLSA
ncbi:Rolling stone [Operophtera brumata]|uniref:Rolling stone n=1 Tax=Operophtera brumata TaxID=104452 RepID=A0A0L7LFY8_OPEBR|nr:Rolling stone [Operophtera brumata]